MSTSMIMNIHSYIYILANCILARLLARQQNIHQSSSRHGCTSNIHGMFKFLNFSEFIMQSLATLPCFCWRLESPLHSTEFGMLELAILATNPEWEWRLSQWDINFGADCLLQCCSCQFLMQKKEEVGQVSYTPLVSDLEVEAPYNVTLEICWLYHYTTDAVSLNYLTKQLYRKIIPLLSKTAISCSKSIFNARNHPTTTGPCQNHFILHGLLSFWILFLLLFLATCQVPYIRFWAKDSHLR